MPIKDVVLQGFGFSDPGRIPTLGFSIGAAPATAPSVEAGTLSFLVGAREVWVYSTATERWFKHDLAPVALYVEEDIDALAAAFGDGFVRDLDVATADDEDLDLDVETKDFVGGSPRTRKLYLWARVNVDTAGATVTLEMYVDGRLRRTASLTGTRTRVLVPFPAGCLGYRWRLRFTYTGQARVKIYGVAAVWQKLAAA